jgi:hypothetical protein
MKKLGIIAVFVILFSQNSFAGGGQSGGAPAQHYATLSENSPMNSLFVGRWKESTTSSSGYDVFEFREDGSGVYILYDAGGFEKQAPVAINYRTSTEVIIVRYSVSGNYVRFYYSFSTDFNTLTIRSGDYSYKYNKVENQSQPQAVVENQNTAQSVPPPLSSSQYNVAINGQNYGPYEMDQLRQMVQQGSLTRETLVWKEGMAQWAAAGTVQELSTLFGTNNPPPLPPPPSR